jgi:TIR domain
MPRPMSEQHGRAASPLTALLEDRDPAVRRVARSAVHQLESAPGADAAGGFVVADSESALRAGALADNATSWSLPVDELIRTGVAGAEVTAVLVTELIDRIIDDPDVAADAAAHRVWQIGTHLATQPMFRPDLMGLLRCYRTVLARSDDTYATMTSSSAELLGDDPPSSLRTRLVIAWIVSRGGLAALVPALDAELGATEPARRYSAALLIAECAGVALHPAPPDVLDPPEAEPAEEPAVVAPEPVLDRDVQFTVYRPRAVRPDRWYPLLAFAHRSAPFLDDEGLEVDPLAEVTRQARGLLGTKITSYGSVVADSARALPRGDELVLEPWLDGGELNPPRAMVRWEEPIHRIEFRLRAPGNTVGRRLDGGMRVYLGVLLVAEVRFALDVEAGAAVSPDAQPVKAAHASPYRRIFASYSHRDTEIVERVRAAATSLGDRYLIDVADLRTGELWEPRLGELIEEASVFQLFWSEHSMRSPFVRQEWEHALSLRRPYFIRPVFWEEPQPADPDADLPPAELRSIQFCRLAPHIAPPPAHPPPAKSVRPDPTGRDEAPASFDLPMEFDPPMEWELEGLVRESPPAEPPAPSPPPPALPVPPAPPPAPPPGAQRGRGVLPAVAVIAAVIAVVIALAVWFLTR